MRMHLHLASAALVAALTTAAMGQPSGRLSPDELFLTKSRWVSLGDNSASYGLEDAAEGGDCSEHRLEFSLDHALTITCTGSKPVRARWELVTSPQDHLLVVTGLSRGRIDYDIYFRPQDPIGFNLVEMKDGKTLPKTETYYGAD